MVAENALKTAGRRFAMLQAVLQLWMSDNPAKFEETWKSWEHQVDIYENLSSTKLVDDVKISVVLREAPQKLRHHLLVNSQQFDSNYNMLSTNKTWIVNDFRETDPMDVDHIGKSKGKGRNKSKSKGKSKGNSKSGSNGKGKSKGKSKDRNQGKGKSKNNSKGKGNGKPDNDKEWLRVRKEGSFRTRTVWSRPITTRW